MKTIKDLLMACVNATLILVALCLFLLWQLSGTIERVTSEFAKNLDVLAPVNARISTLSQEVAGLRDDLRRETVNDAMRAKLSALETEAERLATTLENISNTPERLMQTSISAAATSATDTLMKLRGCEAPET